MKPEHCEALVEGIVDALEAGLAEGGASIDDYRDARGERGSMQDEFLVHTREGQPCPRGDGTIERIVVGGRSTYFCPACQVKLRKRPRRRKRAEAHGGRVSEPPPPARRLRGRPLVRPGGPDRLHGRAAARGSPAEGSG